MGITVVVAVVAIMGAIVTRVIGRIRVHMVVHVVVKVVCVGIKYLNSTTTNIKAQLLWFLGWPRMWYVISVANLATLNVFALSLVDVDVVEDLVVVLHVAGMVVSHVGVPICW